MSGIGKKMVLKLLEKYIISEHKYIKLWQETENRYSLAISNSKNYKVEEFFNTKKEAKIWFKYYKENFEGAAYKLKINQRNNEKLEQTRQTW